MSSKRLVLPIIFMLVSLGLGFYLWAYFSRPLNPKAALAAKADFPPEAAHRFLTQEPEWLNTSRPLNSGDLAGRIVLVDFWTYCCINCMHVIPDLHLLEKEFGNDLTVVGVHSAKFDNEKETENIRSAVLRYGIEHPVVNDGQFKVWESFGVNAWPTLVLLDPTGKIDRVYSGEGHLQDLRKDVTRLKESFAGKFRSDSLPIALEKDKATPSDLNFPSKLEYAADLGILFVSDSSNHRILGIEFSAATGEADVPVQAGKVLFEIGKKGASGNADGDYAETRFNHPQGLLYRDGQLFVADTQNHLLRQVDLRAKRVSTLAGTGSQGLLRDPQNAPALKTPLSSPWDLALFPDAGEIAIAMAGTHQIWSYNISQKSLKVLAGSGRESIDDGSYPDNSLSQPSGLAVWKDRLYFVDAETSSLRVLHDGKVETLLGSGLFDFGFKDGSKGEAKLQHPLGLYADDTGIYIADSYNHALRRYDPATRHLETLAGNGKPGKTEGEKSVLAFNEPNDVLRIGGRLVVVDTNNQRLLDFEPSRGVGQAVVLHFPSGAASAKLAAHLPNLKATPAQTLAAGGNIAVEIRLEPGWKINQQAPSWVKLFETEGEVVSLVRALTREELAKKTVTLSPLQANKAFRLQGTLYFCRDGQEALCYLQSLDQELKVEEKGVNSLDIVLKKDG